MTEAMDRQLDYWKVQLADVPPLNLPTDRPRPAVESFLSGTRQFNVSPDLTAGLNALGQCENVTLFMTLVAAFQVLLHRYCAQDDVVIGASQGDLGAKSFFGDTLVLRSNLFGNPSFCELLAQVRDVTLEAYDHQDIPFEKLVEALNLQSDPSRNSLFQVMFVLHDIADKQLSLNETTKLDLTLELLQTQDGLIGRVEYATDLFEAPTITRLIGHFQTLLEGVIAQPETHLSELPLLTEFERHQLLVEWNDTAVPFPQDKCIHELFEAQVAKTPQAVAVVYEDQRLTYTQLNAQANQLAHYLRSLGVGPEVLIAICLERSLDMVVGLLAILKAGGAYVPLDPSYPQERLAFMLEDSAPLALLTQGRLESLFAGKAKALTVIDLEAERFPWASQPDTNLDRHGEALTPNNLAYVIYTSGSTGKPKGVMVEHINVVNFLSSMTKTPGITRSDSLLAVTTVSFDIAGLEMFLPLINGAKIVLVSRVNAADPVFLQEIIAQSGITLLQATPATWRLLLNGGWQGSSGLKALCGGEALATDLSMQLIESVGELWNLYGPTETTVWSTCQLIGTSWGELYPYEAIGRPIDNTQIYILDAQLQPVPQGVSGEIYIGGAGVTRGYLNRPELTAERFVADPFRMTSDARMYKTGDLARWLFDGSVEYLGRNDFQIKIRGFRIEIGEIEAALRQHPHLREAAVGVYEPAPGDKRLAAYLVTEEDFMPSVSKLRDFLKKKMPEFMVPSVFIFIDALPITPNGKLDRNALPKPDQGRQVPDADFVAPCSQAENLLADIWGNVLKIDRVGVHDNFFELGGNSLLAVMAVSKVNERFNTDLPLGVIYQFPTVEKLGTIIESGNQQPSMYSLVPLQTHGSRPPLFAIHTITLIDLFQHMGNDQPLYFLRYGMAGEISNRPISLPLLEDLASHYIKEMQQVQSQGPYYLMGYSFGGVIAYEMANQLLANGHQVNLVALLDTYLADERRLQPLHRIIHNFFSRSPSQLLALVKNKINNLLTPKEYNTDFWPQTYTLGPDLACRDRYQPKIYNGCVTLFQAFARESMLFSFTSPEYAWEKLLGDRLEVHPISGEHLDIFKEPHVKILVERLMASMDKTLNSG